MTENEQYAADQIRCWVWSGFYPASEIRDMIDDILEEDCDTEMLKNLVGTEIQRKRDTQANWPAVTDCDRLDAVFAGLNDMGICALANAGYTMSDGYGEITEAVAQAASGRYHGYCFYHEQDVQRALDGEGIMLAFGDLRNQPDAALEVGEQICRQVHVAGLPVEWGRTVDERIHVALPTWQRRGTLPDAGNASATGASRTYTVFYEAYGWNGYGCVTPDEQMVCDVEQICTAMRGILTSDESYFGIIDAEQKTMQFCANSEQVVRVELLVPEQQSAWVKEGTLEEAIALVHSAPASLREMTIAGAVFEKW